MLAINSNQWEWIHFGTCSPGISDHRRFTYRHKLQYCPDFQKAVAVADHLANQKLKSKIDQQMTGWWFGTIFIFPYIGNSNPNWRTHIFQRGSYTTNQMMFLVMAKLKHRPCEEIAQRVPVLMWIPDAWNPWNPGWILTTKPHTTSVPPVYHLS